MLIVFSIGVVKPRNRDILLTQETLGIATSASLLLECQQSKGQVFFWRLAYIGAFIARLSG